MSKIMKDSGIEWIREIPEDWKWKRLKNMVSNLGGGNYGEDIKTLDKESVLSKCFSISDFKNGNLNLGNSNKIKMDRVYKKNNTIKKGTLLIEKCGGTKINPVGRIIIVEDDVRSYYTNFVQGVKVNDFMDSKYLYYQLQTTYNLRLHMSNVKQTTGIQNFNFMKFASEKVFLNPPLETQAKIATYLEDNIQSIDEKIAKNKRKIELMKEYREAIIFETVTKGLDKNVKMKDSGIEWIGEIPEDWKWKRLKNMVSNLGGGNYGEDIKTLDKESVLSKCFSISDFKNGNLNLGNSNKIKMDRVYKKNNTIKKGTLLIEKCGGTKINPVGRIIIVEDDVRSYYTNFVQGVKVNDFMDSKYLYYQLQTTYNLRLHMSNVKQTTGIQNFNFMKFASEKVFLNPPLETQKKIADYLDIETEKADDEIEKLNRKNILLEELRNSLIFEAVTGKIDVGVEGEEYKKIISEF